MNQLQKLKKSHHKSYTASSRTHVLSKDISTNKAMQILNYIQSNKGFNFDKI